VGTYELQFFFRRQSGRINAFIDQPFFQSMIPSPREDLPALFVGPLEIFGQIYIIFRKSHSGPWRNEVLVSIGNAQVMLRIEYIDLF
jgi:hypothetical protein